MRQLFVVPFVLFFITACGTVLDPTQTVPREALAKAETVYQGTVAGIGVLVDTGVIKGQNAVVAKRLILTARGALDAWQQNPDSATIMLLAQDALNKMQEFEGRSQP